MTGHYHPLDIIEIEATKHLSKLGFEIIEGQEVVSQWENFDSLNFPLDHPARDAHDTYYLSDNRVLRTHTTAAYVEALQTRKPPLRLAVLGRTFRNEATDSTHNNVFHQLDCLVIEDEASLATLVGTIKSLLETLLKRPINERIRLSYFPFVEPGIEFDLEQNGQFMEVLGAGMLHPNVIKALKLEKGQKAFAFGVGLERILKLRTELTDIRTVFESDYRYLAQ